MTSSLIRSSPHIVYLAVNKVNGKKYVGITCKTLEHRKQQHVRATMRGSSIYLHKAMAKYGLDNFTFTKIADCEGRDAACELEIRYIETYGTFGKGGYNLTLGGESTLGRVKSESQKLAEMRYWDSVGREKHSKRFSGENNPMYGKGYIFKGRIRKRGVDCPAYGRKVSEESRKAISSAKKISSMLRRFNAGMSIHWTVSRDLRRSFSSLDRNDGRFRHQYTIIEPSGMPILCYSMTEFCRIRSLDHSTMQKTYKNGKTHKGYMVVDKEPVDMKGWR